MFIARGGKTKSGSPFKTQSFHKFRQGNTFSLSKMLRYKIIRKEYVSYSVQGVDNQMNA